MSVLIVDDNADMRYLVRVLTELDGETRVVAEATSASGGIELWREHRPDLVVVDYRMHDGTGLDMARIILGEDPGQAIVLFTAFLTDENRREAVSLGIRECLSKDEVRRLPDAIRQHSRA